MRLGKLLAHAGVASRRGAEDVVRAGRVSVDGERVTDPARAVPDDGAGVLVDGKPVHVREDHLVLALNKPKEVVSTASDPQGRTTVLDLVRPEGRRLYPVGRLDADSTGLILLTDDGDLAHRLTHPRFGVEKVYRAKVVRGPVRPRALARLREGVELDDGPTRPAEVRQIRGDLLELVLREGRKRQVRRMCEAVGHPVIDLERVAFGPLRLGPLGEGKARKLRRDEVAALRRAAADGGR